MAVREKEVEAIQAQAQALAQEDQSAGEVERTSRAVEEKFRALCQPMKERCRRLHASREQHQFHRDVEDEIVSHGHGTASCSQPCGSRAHFLGTGMFMDVLQGSLASNEIAPFTHTVVAVDSSSLRLY